jgi:hypothetical protein
MVIRRRKRNMLGNTVGMAVGNIVGAAMIGATANAAAGLPAGPAKQIVSTVPTMQAAALAGANAGYVNRMMPSGSIRRRRFRRRR